MNTNNTCRYTCKGFTLLETLVYLSIITIILTGFCLTTKNLMITYKRKRSIVETAEAIKTAIISSRLARENSQIIYEKKANLIESKLILLSNSYNKNVIQFENKDISKITFSSSSIFKDHLLINSNGFVSPTSLRFDYKDGSKCIIRISRLGAVGHFCEK
jgi:type II secretory pathway pseudopilin PulG